MGLGGLFRDPNLDVLGVALAQAADSVEPSTPALKGVPEFLVKLTGELGHRVTIGGRACLVTVARDVGSRSSRGKVIGAVIRVAIDPVPLAMNLTGRGVRHLGLPKIESGDDAFDAAFRLTGHPAPSVRELFDPATRDTLLRAFATTGWWVRRSSTWITLDKGRLTHFVPIGGSGFFGYRIVPEPAALRAEILATFAFADRVEALISREFKAIERTQGPAQADAWLVAGRAEVAEVIERKRTTAVLVALALMAFAMLSICGGVLYFFSDVVPRLGPHPHGR